MVDRESLFTFRSSGPRRAIAGGIDSMISELGDGLSTVSGERRVTVVLALGETEVLSWPLALQGRPDLAVVDELARLALAARRLGCSIGLRDADRDLWELLELLGLGDVVTGRPELVQVAGEPEQGEESGIEEVVVAHDPPV